MPQPRKNLICVTDTPFYHCVSRCVRRAYLCGSDALTGRSYEHRRKWVENRLLLLGQIFAIDICAYAVMHNHTHVVLHINLDEAKSLSDEEVLLRWHKLHKGMVCCRQFLDEKERLKLSEAELDTVMRVVEIYRNRLCDVSWFMRLLNEYIARKANKEDECTGRFWEGRFKSQALLDDAALYACMAYVDLNPVRAGISNQPEKSAFTSIRSRVLASRQKKKLPALLPFKDKKTEYGSSVLNCTLSDYLALLHSTVKSKNAATCRGIEELYAKIEVFNTNVGSWHCMSFDIERRFGTKVSADIAQRKLAVL